ncbi:hypothetical protein QZH41_008001 [Actinostola sp. cb2023]|nr:hypothetical protein QZH41_008001 [Actinostola sp. cb2023]
MDLSLTRSISTVGEQKKKCTWPPLLESLADLFALKTLKNCSFFDGNFKNIVDCINSIDLVADYSRRERQTSEEEIEALEEKLILSRKHTESLQIQLEASSSLLKKLRLKEVTNRTPPPNSSIFPPKPDSGYHSSTTQAVSPNIEEISKKNASRPTIKRKTVESRVKSVKKDIDDVCKSRRESLSTVFAQGILAEDEATQSTLDEMVDIITEIKGYKEGFHSIFSGEKWSAYFKSLRRPDWALLYYKLKAKLPDESWQTMLNVTTLGRTGVIDKKLKDGMHKRDYGTHQETIDLKNLPHLKEYLEKQYCYWDSKQSEIKEKFVKAFPELKHTKKQKHKQPNVLGATYAAELEKEFYTMAKEWGYLLRELFGDRLGTGEKLAGGNLLAPHISDIRLSSSEIANKITLLNTKKATGLDGISPKLLKLGDHHNYARWLPVHIRDMVKIEKTNPAVAKEFESGHFVVKKSIRAFSKIPLDHAHEQNNKCIKGDGGAVGLTENSSELLRWMISGPEISRMIHEFESSQELVNLTDGNTVNLKHHEQTNAVQTKFIKDVKSVCEVFDNMGNPFTDDSSDLLNLDTKDIMNSDVVTTVRTIEAIGKKKCQDFVENRLEKKTKPLFDTIEKNKLPLFSTPPVKQISRQKLQINSLKQNCALFSQLYVSCQVLQSNLLRFTMELAENNELPFLGMVLMRTGNQLFTRVHRKPTNTRLLLHYHSHVDNRYKRSLLNTMWFNRAYHLSSTRELFREECDRLKQIFLKLKYPVKLVNYTFDSFLKSQMATSDEQPSTTTEEESILRIILPFKDQGSANVLKKQLNTLSKKIGHTIQPVFKSRKINDDLQVREPKPNLANQQCVVYNFKCNLCDAGYVIEEHHYTAVGKNLLEHINYHMKNIHDSFPVLKKCQGKLDCPIYDML